jgi:hypothetical protein
VILIIYILCDFNYPISGPLKKTVEYKGVAALALNLMQIMPMINSCIIIVYLGGCIGWLGSNYGQRK